MNLAVLDKVSTDGLKSIMARCEELLKARLDTTPRPGRMAKFFATNRHEEVTVRIERINRTTASCTEVAPVAGNRWRVHLHMLKVDPVERARPMPVRSAIPHRPASTDDAW